MKRARNFLIIFFCTIFVFSCQESIEKKAERECREYTKNNCPTLLREDVFLDSMTFEKKTRTIHYYYSLCGKLDTTAVDSSTSRVEFLENIRNNQHLIKYKEAGFTFHYTYFSFKQKNKVLLDMSFSPEDYQLK